MNVHKTHYPMKYIHIFCKEMQGWMAFIRNNYYNYFIQGKESQCLLKLMSCVSMTFIKDIN